MPFDARPAGPADVPRILAMMSAFNAFEAIAWTPAAGEAPLRRLLADPSLGHVGLIAEGEDAIGYFVLTWGFDLEWGGRDAFLTELWLEAPARGRGAGRFALEAIERVAEDAGANALHLMVRLDNARAIRVYERAGFTSPPRRFYSKRLR